MIGMAKDLEWPAIVSYEQDDTWQGRLKGEYYALTKRIHLLERMVKNMKDYNPRLIGYIPPTSHRMKTPISVLEAQLKVMKEYREILKDRADRESIDL